MSDNKHSNSDFYQAVKRLMEDRGLWDDCLTDEIPRAFEKYGRLVLFSFPYFSHASWKAAGDDLWLLVCSQLKCEQIAIKGRIKDDRFRSPQVKLIFGTSPYAEFTDNGIKYVWNVEKTMFSRGNVTERHRIARLDCTNETVVDLFAGIGYFTLPYLVHAKAKHVHSCEWNPDALKSLRHNLQVNKVADRCTVYQGDNREVCPKGVADRVNLGLIPSSEASWETACRALVSSGGVLYVHQNVESNVRPNKPADVCQTCERLKISIAHCPRRNLTLPAKIVTQTDNEVFITDCSDKTVTWKWPEWFYFSLHLSHKVLHFAESHHGGQWKTRVKGVFKVKSYAPHIDHLVFDVDCYKIVRGS